ncbi:MAG: YqaA family protein [Desulfatibacillaceae bacterium]
METPDLWLQFGYAGLFALSFCAATLVPLGSEAAVGIMAASGFSPAWVFVVATAGNSLGAVVNYYVGLYGADCILSRWVRVDTGALARAGNIFSRWGSPVLFFAWLPVVGDPLTVAAGVLRVRLAVFCAWVVAGKALRYAVIVGAVAGV